MTRTPVARETRSALRREWRLHCDLHGHIPWSEWKPGLREPRTIEAAIHLTSADREKYGDKFLEDEAAAGIKRKAKKQRVEQLGEVKTEWIEQDAPEVVAGSPSARWMLRAWAEEIPV